MSYVRKGLNGSDVYVWSDGICYVCQECDINGAMNYVAYTPSEMIEHLMEHRSNGYNVPDSAIEKLKNEKI